MKVVPPAPSQTTVMQSPGVCAGIGVPNERGVAVQILSMQEIRRQKPLVDGQSASVAQVLATQCPEPLQISASPVPQGIPAGSGARPQAPFA